jgi:hypothetical protein
VPLADMEDDAAADRESPPREPADASPSKNKKEGPVVKPGRLSNPFEGSATLPAVQTDPTAFAFDFDDEPSSSKKKPASRRHSDEEDGDNERPHSRPVKRPRSSDRDVPDTKHAWGDDSPPPDDLPEDPPRSASGKKDVDVVAPRSDSPFAFDTDDSAARDSRGRPLRHDEDDPREHRHAKQTRHDEAESTKRYAARKSASPASESEAAFLGFVDEPAPEEKKKSTVDVQSARSYFHVRQFGFWEEPHLFRVFVMEDQLAFVAIAAGSAMDEMEDALQADDIGDFDKRIRNTIGDLDELPIDELVANYQDSFRWNALKIAEISIDVAPSGSKAGKRHPQASAVLRLVHKSKGPLAFDFPSDDDVDRALDLLRDRFEELELNIRWDKSSKRFIER